MIFERKIYEAVNEKVRRKRRNGGYGATMKYNRFYKTKPL